MNWFGIDADVEVNGQESNDRPGKFPDIAEFMTIEGFHQKSYISGTLAPVDSGQIIYIKDPSAKDTRINYRVMLVLFHNPPFSYTCLSFCRHYNFCGETLHRGHALVHTDQDEQSETGPSSFKIQLQHNRTPLSLRPDIYLNLREVWNVEQDVQFVVLGHVERNSYERLRSEIGRLFCESLASSGNIRDSETPSALNAKTQESAGPERKHGGGQKDKGHVARNPKEKKRKNKPN